MLRNTSIRFVVMVCLTVVSQWAAAQSSFPLQDSGTNFVTRTFTNSVGTAYNTNGTMIVFEGQLDSTLNIDKKYNAGCDTSLASVQLLLQIKLFDDLPYSNELANVQGAVAAWRDSPGSSNGTYYVWGSTNSVPMTWLQLKDTNSLPFHVFDGETNYITLVFSYPAVGPVTYYAFVGKPLPGGGKGDMFPSEAVTSLTSSATSGISSLSLLGAGVVQEIGTSSGTTAPLSTSISMSVYFSSNSVCADVATVNENGTSPIRIYAKINGVWTLVGTISSVNGDGDGHMYRHVVLSGLTAGKTYNFQIVDESDHVHYVDNVTVETITIGEAVFVKGAMQTLEVTFNTTQGRYYQVKVCDNPAASADQWSLEYVSQYKGDGVWGASSTSSFQAGPGTQTLIRIPINKTKAFFRIVSVDGE